MHGIVLPSVVSETPELLPGLDLFYEAFLNLNTCRSIGFDSFGFIPWTAIIAYCDEAGLTGDTRDIMVFHIQGMDGAYLKWQSKKKDKKT